MKQKQDSYPLKPSDPLLIKVAYLMIEVAVALWLGASVCAALTGGF